MNEIKTPWELFGVDCGEGWFPLIKPVLEYIEDYNKDKSEEKKTVVYQVKEKWGTLVIEAGNYTEELYELIESAEKKSATVCEVCGAPASLRKYRGWYKTLCDDCWTKKQNDSDIHPQDPEKRFPDYTK